MLNTPPTFPDLIDALSPTQVEYLEKEMSKTKFTQILNNPARASNDELLLYAEVLQLSAYELIAKYELGKDRITKREYNNHRLFAALEQKAAA